MDMRKFDGLKKYKYTPKEAFGYFVRCYKSARNFDFENIIFSLENELWNYDKLILNGINANFLTEIKNYWSLSANEVFAYGFLVFRNLNFEGKKITEDSILNEFNYIMRLYSPSNAVEFLDRL